MNQYALELSELSKYYDDKPVIKNISLSLKSGEILGILGQNASAKSTLIKILGGLVQPNRGQISLFGEQVKIKSPSKATALGIIALYENSPLPENLTVSQALFLGTYRKINPRSVASSIGLVSNKKMDLEAKRYLEEYNFDVDIRSKVDSLSPAQRQMLVLIRSVVLNAKILLVDNCFSLLNASEIKEVHRILKKLKIRGISIIITSQKYHHIFDVADTIAIMENNSLTVQENTTDTSFLDPFTKRNTSSYPKLDIKKGSILFECRNICYKDIVKDVSFSVLAGEIVGIIGNPSSGRITLPKLLCGETVADIGKILIKGKELKLNQPSGAKKNGIMMISDDSQRYGLIPKVELASNIALSNYKKASFANFILSEKELYKSTLSLADSLGIKYNYINQQVQYLSAGNKQKIAFARAIFSNTEVYLISEPTMGIDTIGSIQIYNIMNELAREGKCLILFTSNLREAMGMCDRILVMRDGRVVGKLSRNEFSETAFESIDMNY